MGGCIKVRELSNNEVLCNGRASQTAETNVVILSSFRVEVIENLVEQILVKGFSV